MEAETPATKALLEGIEKQEAILELLLKQQESTLVKTRNTSASPVSSQGGEREQPMFACASDDVKKRLLEAASTKIHQSCSQTIPGMVWPSAQRC